MSSASENQTPRAQIGAVSNSYARMPEHFYARVSPVAVGQPGLIRVNRPLARELGLDLDSHNSDALAALFSGNLVPHGAEPIAMAYAGHQFGHFVPQLGDGRAILLGEVRDAAGRWRDIQLKGSGRTPFSRGGDGRAALGPVLREYLVSEAMQALGIPTTRALAAVTTGETLIREGNVPGAVLTRVAAGFVRVGTFQYFAARDQVDAVRRLADYVIERHFPSIQDSAATYLALLREVVERQALLIAHWMGVGFIHGVMNTDNMAVSGETIDFGPCAFMDHYDPGMVFSSIDHAGRYAYANQPIAAQWNLARFAETLLPLIDAVPERAVEQATEAVNTFSIRHAEYWLVLMRRKLGLLDVHPGDLELVNALLGIMHANRADFTLTFRGLCDAASCNSPPAHGAANAAADTNVRSLFADAAAFDAWAVQWRTRLRAEGGSSDQRILSMRGSNPAYIPRNHRVEQIIRAAVDHGDFAPFNTLLEVLMRPYEERDAYQAFAQPPAPAERIVQTFCGT